MESLWKRFEAWLAGNSPGLSTNLNAGAAREEIQALERLIGVQLPEDFVMCYLIHDGQEVMSAPLFKGDTFMSLQRIAYNWQVLKELWDEGDFADSASQPAAGIKGDWWNPRWIPFSDDMAGNHLCLDLDPFHEGRFGQVIDFVHDSAERFLEADSFENWFRAYVEGMENGLFVYSTMYGAIVGKTDVDALQGGL